MCKYSGELPLVCVQIYLSLLRTLSCQSSMNAEGCTLCLKTLMLYAICDCSVRNRTLIRKVALVSMLLTFVRIQILLFVGYHHEITPCLLFELCLDCTIMCVDRWRKSKARTRFLHYVHFYPLMRQNYSIVSCMCIFLKAEYLLYRGLVYQCKLSKKM